MKNPDIFVAYLVKVYPLYVAKSAVDTVTSWKACSKWWLKDPWRLALLKAHCLSLGH